jgi:hypothetical protein
MASLIKKPNCHNWIACFTLPDGRRTQRSTGTSSRKDALKVAAQFEAATTKARTTRQAHRVVRDIYAELTGETLKTQTFNTYLADWYARKEKEIEAVSLAAGGALAPTLRILTRLKPGEKYPEIVSHHLGEKPVSWDAAGLDEPQPSAAWQEDDMPL